MPRLATSYLVLLAGLALFTGAAMAAPIAFITPSDSIAITGNAKPVTVQFGLLDPLTRRPLELAKPKRFGVQYLGDQSDLLANLKTAAAPGADPSRSFAWTSEFAAKRPGDYTFYGETAPLWDAAEDLFVILSGKVCVNVPGLEEGWDEPVGLELEIIPLSRPYGLWTGNLFSGQVLLKGEPVPYVEVAVSRSYDPAAPPLPAALPAAYAVQKVRADSNGIFHYAMPRSGWWGFTALGEAEWSLKRSGDDKPVLLGAGYWVQTKDLP